MTQPVDPMQPDRLDAQGRRLCGADTRGGGPCRAPAVMGTTRCRMHGGTSPEAKAKSARFMLLELCGPAIERLRRIIEDPNASDAAAATASKAILDRAGYGPSRSIEFLSEEVLDREIARMESELDAQQPDWRDDYSG